MIVKNKNLLSITMLLLVLWAMALWWIAHSTDKKMRAELLQQARLAAMGSSFDLVTQLSGSEKDLGTNAYKRIKSQLALLREAKPNCRFLYLMGRRVDGKIFFFTDSLLPGTKGYAPPGLLYEKVPESYIPVFEKKKEAVVGPITEQAGTLITALIPIVSQDTHTLLAVMRMDVEARNWNQEIINQCIGPSLVVLLLIALFFIMVSLRASEKRYRSLFGNMLNGFAYHKVIFDGKTPVDFKYLAVNSAFERQTGLKNAVGKKVSELIPGIRESDPELIHTYYRVASTGQAEKFEMYMESLSIWVSVSAYCPEKGYFVATFDNITDRKKSETALKASEERYRRITENAPDMIYRMSLPDGKYEYVSPASVPIYGYSPEEFYDNPFLLKKVIHPNSLHYFKEQWGNLIKGIVPDTYEYQITHKNGDTRWLNQRNVSIRNDNGELMAIEGIVTDITDRKQKEQALREKDRFQEALLNDMLTFVGILEANGDIIFVNNTPLQVTGVRLQDIKGKKFYDAPWWRYSDKARETVIGDVEQCAAGKSTERDIQVRIADGSLMWIEYSMHPILNEQGAVQYLIPEGRDITGRKRMEEVLQQSQKMEAISTLSGGIAHDFNNVLSVLKGNLSYALSIIKKEDELYEVLSDVLQGTAHAQNLTNQFLTFAKGGAPVKKVEDVNKIIGESARFASSGTKSRIDFKLSENLKTAEIDVGQINQVISNLVINADQAMPNGGIIFIKSENVSIETNSTLPLTAGAYIKISVKDQGTGIKDKHLSNIFDPYFTTKQEGSGLGLAVAYSIIKKHDGHIAVYSEEGKGTVFTIYLPASTSPFKEREDVNTPHQGQGRILVMDDQEPILRMISRMLDRMGYETETASNGVEAVNLCREAYNSKEPYDLVILDLTIPGGMGGEETVAELIKIDPNVKAIVSSGYSNNPIMSNYQDYGFCGVVSKPYSRQELSEVLNKIFN